MRRTSVRSNPSTRSSTSWRGARRRASAAVLNEIGYGSSRLATVAAVRRSAQRPHATSRPVRCGATDRCQASAAAVRSSVSVYSAPEPKQNGAECIVQRAECIVTRASCVCCQVLHAIVSRGRCSRPRRRGRHTRACACGECCALSRRNTQDGCEAPTADATCMQPSIHHPTYTSHATHPARKECRACHARLLCRSRRRSTASFTLRACCMLLVA